MSTKCFTKRNIFIAVLIGASLVFTTIFLIKYHDVKDHAINIELFTEETITTKFSSYEETINSNFQHNKPNILFILADDYGYNDIGYNADDIETPNLDYLANNGLKLTNYYTLCICSASRGVILTGRYDIHIGMRGIVTSHSFNGINLNETLISNILYQYGNYNTYAIGKWHVGESYWEYTPTHRGFKYFYGMLGGASDYFTHTTGNTFDWSEHIGINCNLSIHSKCARIAEETYGIYSTHLMTTKTINIIKNHSNSTNKPFFIYLSYQAIHSPEQVPKSYALKYKNIIKHGKRRIAAGMIDCMDEGIGNITKTLIDYNLINNTIIIFTSDNGAAIYTTDSVGGENWPLRGGKHSIYEGGTKVPAIIYYPNLQQNISQKNHQYKYLFHCADWTPTLIEAAGLSIHKLIGVNGKYLNLDGKSHWNNLNTLNGRDIREWVYYGHENPINSARPGKAFGLRWKQYKMLFRGGGKPNLWYKYKIGQWNANEISYLVENETVNYHSMHGYDYAELYDIEHDPLEINNLMNNMSIDGLVLMLQQQKNQVYQSFVEFGVSKHRDIKDCNSIKYIPLITINDSNCKLGGKFPRCSIV